MDNHQAMMYKVSAWSNCVGCTTGATAAHSTCMQRIPASDSVLRCGPSARQRPELTCELRSHLHSRHAAGTVDEEKTGNNSALLRTNPDVARFLNGRHLRHLTDRQHDERIRVVAALPCCVALHPR